MIDAPNHNDGAYQGSLTLDNTFAGTGDSDTIRVGGGENEVTGGKGDDIIFVGTENTPNLNASDYKGTVINYNYTNGDGKDEIYGATNLDTLNISTGDANVYIRYKNVSGNLQIGFYDKNSSTDNVLQTVTIRDYFSSSTASVAKDENAIDKIIINGETKSLANELINNGVIGATDNYARVRYLANEPLQADEIAGSPHNDIIFGTSNDDIISVSSGYDIVYGGDGDDVINGNQGILNSELQTYGNGTGSKVLFGEGGNDIIYSGTVGQTEITGGRGDDTIYVQNSAPSLGLNNDQIESVDEQTGLIIAYAGEDGSVHPSYTKDNYHHTVAVGYVVEDRRSEGLGVDYFTADADARFDAAKINYDYTNGDGNDVIEIGYDVNYRREQQLDSIYINLGSSDVEMKNLKTTYYDAYGNQHNDLVIQFYNDGVRDEDNSITIKDYFTRNEASRLKHVFVNKGDGNGYVESEQFLRVLNNASDYTANRDLYLHSGMASVSGGLYGDDSIYVDDNANGRIDYNFTTNISYYDVQAMQDKNDIHYAGGMDTVYNAGARNILRVNSDVGLNYEYQRRENDPDKMYDLEINLSDGVHSGSIILKDYFKQDANVRMNEFYINNDAISFAQWVAEHEGNSNHTDADVVLTDTSRTYTFAKTDFDNVENNTLAIASEGSLTKTVKFTQYSYEDNELEFGYDPQYQGNEVVGISDNIKLMLFEENEHGENIYTVRYQDYLSADNNSLIIEDKYRSYGVSSHNSAVSLNWTNDGSNHLTFIQSNNENDSVITSGSGHNIIQTNGGTGMTYTYNGGKDSIGTQSLTSDDTYNIALNYNNSESGTAVSIYDAGGNDTLNILSSVNDLRLVFNYDISEVQGNDYLSGIDNTIMLMHNDAFGMDSIISAASGENRWTSGVVNIDADTDGNGFGIENVNSLESGVTTTVNTEAWASAICQEIAGWLGNHQEYSSVADAVMDNNTDVLNCFMSYNDAMIYNQNNP